MTRLRLICAVVFALGVNLILTAPAQAHHNPGGILPLVPNTWLIKSVWADGEITWCVDARASAYPGFVGQLQQVNDAAYKPVRVPHRQIPGVYRTEAEALAAGCKVWHTMPDAPLPVGVAGQIHYANRPVTVEYAWRLGYRDFRTTQGHEGTVCGHAMGEHEGYDDDRFVSHFRTYGFWASPWNAPNVMDFGTAVWECQDSDRALIWSWLLPKQVKEAGIRNWRPATEYAYRGQLYYCGGDTLRADRVAVMGQAPDGTYFWTGNHLPVSSGCVELALFSLPGYCFFASTEASAWVEQWTRWEMRNDAAAGCV